MNPIRHRGRRLAAAVVYDRAFKMLIDTTKAGSGTDTFVLPTTGAGYNFTIYWGDGTFEVCTGTPGNITHVYPLAGTYIVSIRERAPAGFRQIYFNNGGDKLKVMAILQWGENVWASLQGAFSGCENMRITATDHRNANTKNVSIFNSAFYRCFAISSFPPLDTSSATQMSGAWRACTGLKSFPAVQCGKVTNIDTAWQDCTGLAGYAFPTIDLRAVTTAINCFSGWAMSTTAYSDLIISTDALNANTGVTFHGGTAKYNAGAADARYSLDVTKTWTITDGGAE